jgi:hypothetical protein
VCFNLYTNIELHRVSCRDRPFSKCDGWNGELFEDEARVFHLLYAIGASVPLIAVMIVAATLQQLPVIIGSGLGILATFAFFGASYLLYRRPYSFQVIGSQLVIRPLEPTAIERFAEKSSYMTSITPLQIRKYGKPVFFTSFGNIFSVSLSEQNENFVKRLS